jgi:UPF0755 protein
VIRKLLLIFLLLALGCILALQELERRWQEPLAVPEDGLVLAVAQGESLRAVANRLQGEGVLPHPNLLIAYGRWTGIDQQIKHGEYLLVDPLDAKMLLELLRSGKVIQYQVTIPEGVTLAQTLDILAAQADLERVLEGPADERIQTLVAPFTHPEGLFFPDTYHYARNTTDLELLRRANQKMLSVLDEEWQGRAEELPYETPYQALIMASIIERETGLPEERQEIAGVFVRRISRGMRLQTDPTVIYGIGPEFDGNLRRAHLNDEDNAYNTYRIDGLPPTPIALPGRAAIHAALHPAEGTTLFFVARGDGGHVFSTTLREHEAAVRKYQLQRREDYRSSPEGR